MKKAAFISVFCFIVPVVCGQEGKKIVILHTNDLHSRLTGFAPELLYTPLTINDDKTVGGFARIASVIKKEKEHNNGTTLILDAGDFLMGTLFASLEPQTGFQLRLMKTMGYDAVCIGNHEFDYGPGKLADIVKTSAAKGKIPELFLGNAEFDENDKRDDALEKLFSDGVIKRKSIIEKDGLRIGFFSLMGKVADENAAFAPPVRFENQVRTARKLVKELKAEKCDLIICLSHSGVERDKKGNWAGEDVELARKVKGISVIVSGHTHTELDQPIIVNGVPVIQAGDHGRFVGRLELTCINGSVRIDSYALLPVDDRIAGDPEINNLIEEQKSLVNSQILSPLGMDYSAKVAETGFELVCDEQGDYMNSNLGPLVADAIHSYVNNHAADKADLSMVAVGVISEPIIPVFESAPDLYRVMMMGTGKDNIPGYPLAMIYITGHELKSVLEILMAAGKSTPANYCFYAGIRAEYDPGRGLLKKITRLQILHPDGSSADVDFSRKNPKLYAVAANAYMLQFVGIIKKMSFGLINVVPKDKSGNPVMYIGTAWIDMDPGKEGIQEGKEWLALMEFITLMKDTNGNGIPDIDVKYRNPVRTFFQVQK